MLRLLIERLQPSRIRIHHKIQHIPRQLPSSLDIHRPDFERIPPVLNLLPLSLLSLVSLRSNELERQILPEDELIDLFRRDVGRWIGEIRREDDLVGEDGGG